MQPSSNWSPLSFAIIKGKPGTFYPKESKSFKMRCNDDDGQHLGKEVRCRRRERAYSTFLGFAVRPIAIKVEKEPRVQHAGPCYSPLSQAKQRPAVP